MPLLATRKIPQRIQAWRHVFRAAFLAELQHSSRRRTFHWLGWFLPLLLFVLTSGIFLEGTLLDMPVAVVDNDNSTLSRQITRELDAAPHSRVLQFDAGLAEAMERLRGGDVYALLYLPHNLERDVLGGRQPSVSLYYNGLFYAAGSFAAQDVSAVMAHENDAIRQLQATVLAQPLPTLSSINASNDNLFNPSGNYAYYQQLVMLTHLLQLFIIVATVHLLGREAPERHADNLHTLRPHWPLMAQMLGKLAPYTLVYFLLYLLELCLLVALSGARINGSISLLLLTCFCYVLAAQSIGLLLFTLTSSRFLAYSLVGMLVGIAQAYSGVMFPTLAMPEAARVIAELEPLSHAMKGIFDQFLRAAPARLTLAECLLLLVYPAIALTVARSRLARRLNLVQT